MNIIQEIRETPRAGRFAMLVTAVCGEKAQGDSECVCVISVEQALHKLEAYQFRVEAVFRLTVTPMNADSGENDLVITEGEFGRVTKKEKRGTGYPVYEFLSDYLGLGVNDPLSATEMSMKYPQALHGNKGDISEADWYSSICETLLGTVRREIYGPAQA